MTRALIKNGALQALRSAGLFRIVSRSNQRRQRLLILCFHGISLRDEDQWNGLLYITARQFGERMRMLKAWDATVLPLGEGLTRLANQSLPERSVCITFDDGFYDFQALAYPILQEYGYPSTVYLTTHYCKHSLPVFNLALDYLLWKAKGRVDLSEFGSGLPVNPPADTFLQRYAVVDVVKAWADQQAWDTAQRDSLLARIARQIGFAYDEFQANRIFQLMTPEEVTRLARAGVDIQLHTHRHRAPVDRDLFHREIRENSRFIQDLTGKTPEHFCYPSGLYAYEHLPWLKELGVKSATTCEAGSATIKSEPLLLPRFLDHSGVSDLDFESWVAGVRR